MRLNEFCDMLQNYCNRGFAQDEVEILDEDLGEFLALDKVNIERDHEREVVAIEFRHKRK